jgi:hypothetical protein
MPFVKFYLMCMIINSIQLNDLRAKFRVECVVLDLLQVSLLLKLAQGQIPLNTYLTSKSASHRKELLRLN